jgi:hypothetical protein
MMMLMKMVDPQIERKLQELKAVKRQSSAMKRGDQNMRTRVDVQECLSA